MKKAVLFLSVVLCLSLCCNSVVFAVQETDYVDPFTGYVYTEDELDGNGVVFVILNHEYSIEWKEYTVEDFPGMNLESVKNHPPFSENREQIIADPEYRNITYLVLKDKTSETMKNAIDLLYERHDEDIYFACPVGDVFYEGFDWIEDETIPEYVPDGLSENTGVSIILSYSSAFDGIYSNIEEIPVGSEVYYKIVCEDGYFCHGLRINTDTINEKSFTMPTEKLDITLDVYRYGDTDGNDTVNLADVSFVLKYLAKDAKTHLKVNGKACGDLYLDFNNNGKVNLSDCAEMLKYIAKWKDVGPIAPDNEDSFNITHIDSTAEVVSYYTDMSSLILNFDGRCTIEEYNSSVISNSYDWYKFIEDTMGVNDTFNEISDDGEIIYSDVDVIDIRNRYDDEFFENNDLVPLIVHSDHYVSISAVRRTGSTLRIEIKVGEKANQDGGMNYNECSFLFVTVPQNCTDERTVTVAESGVRPNRLVMGFDY